MSGVKGRSGRPKSDVSNEQLFGYVPEEMAIEIQQEAIKQNRSLNNFVGTLISDSWIVYKRKNYPTESRFLKLKNARR